MRFMADFALISKKGCALKSDEFTFASYDPAPAARRVAHLPPLMRATVLFSDGRLRPWRAPAAPEASSELAPHGQLNSGAAQVHGNEAFGAIVDDRWHNDVHTEPPASLSFLGQAHAGRVEELGPDGAVRLDGRSCHDGECVCDGAPAHPYPWRDA